MNILNGGKHHTAHHVRDKLPSRAKGRNTQVTSPLRSEDLPKKKCVVGVIYASWCPHCKTLVGEEGKYEGSDWHRIETLLNQQNKTQNNIEYLVNRAESEEKEKINELNKKHISATGYPTIYKYYDEGEVEYYNGPRDVGSLQTWAMNHSNLTNPGAKDRWSSTGTGMKFSGGGTRVVSRKVIKPRPRKNTKRRRGNRRTRRL